MITHVAKQQVHTTLLPHERPRHFKQMASEFYGLVTLFRDTPLGTEAVVLFDDAEHCAAFVCCRANLPVQPTPEGGRQ